MGNLNVDLSGLSSWELSYSQKLVGDPANYRRKPKIPCIAPLEIPFLFDSRIFLVGASNLQKTWFRAGYLYYEVEGIKVDDRLVFTDFPSAASTAADASRHLVPLNSLDLVVFPRLSDQVRLRFEAVPWLEALTLAIWEYKGRESDSTEDQIEALRSQVATLDFKLDNL
ncbi:MAG: hypothetical protein H7Z11_15695 [Verrucomicrobia bacterium]|nr:hypothetical protein [Leptolyngbya sp. ES-bin-22]